MLKFGQESSLESVDGLLGKGRVSGKYQEFASLYLCLRVHGDCCSESEVERPGSIEDLNRDQSRILLL